MYYEGYSQLYASQKRGSSAYETIKECFQAKVLKGSRTTFYKVS